MRHEDGNGRQGGGWKKQKIKTKTKTKAKGGKKSESAIFAKAIDFGLACWKDGVKRDLQAGDLRVEDFDRALAAANIDPETFSAVQSKQLVFPTSLTPLQRRLVHKGAVRLGLFHASCGSGDQRRVVVSQTQVRCPATRAASAAVAMHVVWGAPRSEH